MPPRQTTGCAHPPTIFMHDFNAERVVLRELMWHPRAAALACDNANLGRGDFYQDVHGRLYDVLRYLLTAGDCCLLGAYREIRKRREGRLYAGTPQELALWLYDVWATDPWLPDAEKWWPKGHETVAAAASLKIVWNASRRALFYKAQELLRDAVNPVGGADENFYRADP